MSNRRSQLRVAYAPGFTAQSGFGVPLSPASLTKVLVIREGGQSHIEPIFRTEDINDCTTQYLLDLIVLHRIARLTLDIEVDVNTIKGLFGMAMGVTTGSVVTMLGPTTFVLPATTFIVGFDDGVDPGIVFSDAVCESLTLTGRVEQKFQVRAVFVGRGDMLDAVGFDFPECESIVPLRFDMNSLFTVNGVEYIDNTRAFECTYGNNVPLNDFPFSLASVDITRPLERGDKRQYVVNWTVTGREGDPLSDAAISVPPTHYDFTVRIAEPGGTGIELIAADAMIRPQGNALQSFDGEVSMAVLQLMLTPIRVPGDAATPLSVEVVAFS